MTEQTVTQQRQHPDTAGLMPAVECAYRQGHLTVSALLRFS